MFPHNNEGRDVLLKEYDQEELQAIANHGCSDGVCFKHIYYGDTIAFFDKYEAEILSEITEILGVDTLVDIFKEHDADYNAYRNDCTWTFIELVAMDVVTEMERIEYEQDELIESYMKENISNNGYTLSELNESAEDLMNLSVYNPPNSMTDSRYAQV